LLEALDVALVHIEVGQEVVRQEHWLGSLEMGIPGNGHAYIGFGKCQKCFLKRLEPGYRVVYGFLGEQPHVEGYLVVPRAGGVKHRAGIAYLIDEAGLDVHVYVFELFFEFELALLDLLSNRGKPHYD